MNKNKNILLVASNPPGKVDLKLINSEVGKIYENTSGWATVTPLRQPKMADIQRELPIHGVAKYDIVHLAGHNSEAGFYFCDFNLRKPEPLNREGFKALFQVKNPPELLVLNACATREIAEAIKDIVPYIIYTSVNIPDEIALEFSDAFYQYAKDFSENPTEECYRMAFAEAVRRTRMHNTANDTFLFYTDSGKKLLNGLDFLDGKEIKPLEDICRNDIFISCSHEEEDKPHFEEVKKQLESLKYYGVEANVWDNTQISLGDNREKEIAQALKKTRIAVLLVSPKFIASKFINEIELVSFKELVEKEKGKIMPILLRKVPFNLHPFLKKYQFLNADKPMNDITQDEKDGLYVKLIREIEEVYKKDSK